MPTTQTRRKLSLTLALVTIVSCQEAPSPPTEKVSGPGVSAAAESWCPEDTTQRGAPPPLGVEVACVGEDGALQGRSTRWFDNGFVAEDGHYLEGARQGRWTTRWRRSGRLQSEGEYRGGEKQGAWRFFNKKGQVKEEALFKMGRLVEMKKIKHGP